MKKYTETEMTETLSYRYIDPIPQHISCIVVSFNVDYDNDNSNIVLHLYVVR